jgi:4-amino-4-deoxy-L-arabinose transferase-like glycosyltransferase
VRPLALLLIIFVLLGTVYSIVTPLFEASDELWHYPFIKRLADGEGLPVLDPANPGPWRQEAGQPPLYYALGALATFWIDTGDINEVRWINPHADIGIPQPDGNVNMVVHGPRAAFPWQGTALAMHIVRLLSVLMGAGTVALTYFTTCEVLPGRRHIALAAAALTAFTPMFLFISSVINNDNLVNVFSAWALLLLVRFARDNGQRTTDDRPSTIARRPSPVVGPAFIGLVIGLAALSKLGGALLGVLAVLACAAVARRARSLRAGLVPLVLIGTVAALVAGWWYVRNWTLYGDLTGLNRFLDVVGRRHLAATPVELWGERWGFMAAYWGFFGGVNVLMPTLIYNILNILALLALAGLVAYFARKLYVDRLKLERWLSLLLLLAWIALVTAGVVQWAGQTPASQGRLLFPAITALSTLFALGLTVGAQFIAPFLARVTRRQVDPTYAPWAVAAFLFVVALVAPFAWIRPAYTPPPPLTAQEQADIPNRTDVTFGGVMHLMGYRLEANQVEPGAQLPVTLYWQALASMDRDYSVFVHLLDENDVVVAQRDTYPGLGLLATRLLAPGQTWADRYVLQLPPSAYAPSQTRIEVGLYDLPTGQRLQATGPDGTALGDNVRLGAVSLVARPGTLPNPVAFNFGNQIELAGYTLVPRTAQPGETLRLTLYWRGLRPIDRNYTVFTHVLGEGQRIWGQKDAWPQDGAAPTAAWAPGQVVEDYYELTLSPETPPAVYDIEIGLYLGETGERLRLIAPDGRPTEDNLRLTRVRVQ